MVCGGFACSKNCLCALNLLYTLVSLLLIGIAAWGIGFGLISSLRVVGVVIAVGIFLFLIALVGLIGAVKHHQVLLFFYMIILLVVFIVQFSVSCACLALNQEQQGQLLEVGWNSTASARNDIQRNLNCCGFRNFNPNDTCLASCFKSGHPCSPCAPIIGEYICWWHWPVFQFYRDPGCLADLQIQEPERSPCESQCIPLMRKQGRFSFVL
uniref:Tetraspanin 13 n=2 Tax=Cercopithecinae TaxID=9528 RepID=A0A2K5MEU0_CERAT